MDLSSVAQFEEVVTPSDPGGWDAAPSPDEMDLGGFRLARRPTAASAFTAPVNLAKCTDPDGISLLTWPEIASALSTYAPTFGINNAHVEEGEVRSGATPSIFDSLSGARAAFVRQPGFADLLWPRGADLPRPTSSASDLSAELMPLFDLYFRDYLVNMLGSLPAGMQVVFTFVSLGGAVEGGVTDADPYGELTNVPSLSWRGFGGRSSSDWATLECDGVVYTYNGGVDNSHGGQDFIDGSLDPRDAFKRCYLRKFAYQIAKYLDSLGYGGRVAGIEIVDEVSTSCVTADLTVGAGYWGGFAAQVARGFLDYYADGGTRYPLWFPSLASPRREFDWAEIASFHEAMVDAAAADLGAELDVFVNQDCHWYRFLGSQAPVPALQMVALLSALRANLDAHGCGAALSVCETGAAVGGRDAQYPSYARSEADAQLRFQAREVVRRLMTASIGGASRVAWHSHMGSSTSADSFYGTGLRTDDTTITQAADAHARPSWFTFRRLSRKAQELGAVPLEVVLPARRDPADYGDLDTSSLDDVLTVLHFLAAGGHLYVVFLDSAAVSSILTCAVEVGGADSAELIGVHFPAISEGTSFAPEEFSIDSASAEHGSLRLPAVLAVNMDQDPTLLFSPEELTFTRTTAPGVLPFAGLTGHAPARPTSVFR